MGHNKGFQRLNLTVYRVIRFTGILVVVFCVLTYLFWKDPIKEILGILSGAVLGLFAFLDLKNTLLNSTVRTPKSAKIYASIRYFLRFAVVGIVFALIIKRPDIGILGGVVGFLLVKISIYATNISKK